MILQYFYSHEKKSGSFTKRLEQGLFPDTIYQGEDEVPHPVPTLFLSCLPASQIDFPRLFICELLMFTLPVQKQFLCGWERWHSMVPGTLL